MLKFAKIIDDKTKAVSIGNGNILILRAWGYIEQEVEQAYNGSWYLQGYAPEKPIEEMQAEVRAVRNSYLEKYVDPKQLVMVWDGLSEEEKQIYADYRGYLLDYTEQEDWYLQNPMTLDEWLMVGTDEISQEANVSAENEDENTVEEIGEDKESEDLTSE